MVVSACAFSAISVNFGEMLRIAWEMYPYVVFFVLFFVTIPVASSNNGVNRQIMRPPKVGKKTDRRIL